MGHGHSARHPGDCLRRGGAVAQTEPVSVEDRDGDRFSKIEGTHTLASLSPQAHRDPVPALCSA